MYNCRKYRLDDSGICQLKPGQQEKIMNERVKCACPSCNCAVSIGKGVLRDGKIFCSKTCAYECTEQTCVCVHERCEEEK